MTIITNPTKPIYTNGNRNGYHAAVNDPFPQDDDVYIPSPDDIEAARDLFNADLAAPEAKATPPAPTAQADPVSDKSIDNESFWLTHPAGEYGNMLCFKEKYGKRLAYNSAYGWMYQSEKQKRWLTSDLAEAAIDRTVMNALLERQSRAGAVQNDAIASKSACTTRNISNVRNMIRSFVTVLPSEFDNDPDLLNTRSGVIDLRTGRIVADESGKFTYCCPVEYDANTDYSPWLTWLDATIKNHTDGVMRDWLQMCMGYSITGHTREECLFSLWGPTRSGKGTLNHVQLSLLGDPLGRGAAFSTFTRTRDGNSFDLAPLKAARLIVASEGEKKTPLNAATVKTITGRDPITCAFKGKDEFTYYPQFKIWLASNHKITGPADDDAFWNRVKVISCPWSKAGSEDKELKQNMSTPDYLRMVLTYAVLGAKMWWNSPKGLITPASVTDTVQDHRDAADSVGQWIADNVTRNPAKEAGHAKLHVDYETWCKENGFIPKMGKAFAESMAAKGFEQIKFYFGEGKDRKQIRGYKGGDLSE